MTHETDDRLRGPFAIEHFKQLLEHLPAITALIVATSVVLSVVFNLEYFRAIRSDILLVLTIQDYLSSAFQITSIITVLLIALIFSLATTGTTIANVIHTFAKGSHIVLNNANPISLSLVFRRILGVGAMLFVIGNGRSAMPSPLWPQA